MENTEKDMNLFDFMRLCWNATGRGLKRFALFLLQTLRLGLQYFWVVVICVVLSGIFGWLWTKPFATKFTGDATVLFTRGMRPSVEDALKLFISSDYDLKIQKYGVPDSILSKTKRINIYNVIDAKHDSVADFVDLNYGIQMNDTMDVVMMDRLHIRIVMKGEKDFSSFQTGIARFVNDQPSVVRADEYCKAKELYKLNYIEREVARLDSFSTHDYFRRPRALGQERWGSMFITERDQELYYEDILIMLDKKDYVENHIAVTPEIVNFQSEFIVSCMPPIFKYAISLFLGLVLGLLVALLIKYRVVVIAYFREK